MEPTLENIAQQKAAVMQQIRRQQEVMSGLAGEIFAPLKPATGKATAMMRAVNTGMAIFDGLLLGMKLTRKFQGLFKAARHGT